MSKAKYYSVNSLGSDNCEITFHKNKDDGLIKVTLDDASCYFTVKEARDIVDQLKQCIRD